jgi:glycosyltransferase involved in cell wall biosynthesis
LRLLLSAYACEPGKGSEPGVGWNWVLQAARFHEVWVITRANNRETIQKAAEELQLRNVHFEFFDLPRGLRFWKRGQKRIRLYYYLWQLGAFLRARALHRRVAFDVAHHVTFVTFWMPSFMSLLPVPFIWGPVGGGESMPPTFRRGSGMRARFYELARDLARILGRMDPAVRLTARRATLALATTRATEKEVRALGSNRTLLYSEAGLQHADIERLAQVPVRRDAPFRIISVGRLLHWKGFHLGIRAFAGVSAVAPGAEYWIVGAGPDRARLEAIAADVGVSRNVRFFGSQSREKTLEFIASADVLLHPSLHDSGGWVCLEAMAAGKPAVCLDLGGPAVQVTHETGIKVPAREPGQAVQGLAHALIQLAQDMQLRCRLGEAGRARVRSEFQWDRKGEWMNALYLETLRAAGRERAIPVPTTQAVGTAISGDALERS